ncbi:ribosomal protein L4 domain-containing protein [Pyronema domesticum]|nr:ribosomal protein L4 domain-containing protein [Pyronema domesticum]
MATARSICSKARLLAGVSRVGVAQDIMKPVFAATRSMATAVTTPAETPAPFALRKAPTVLATLHTFPTMEPVRFEEFPSTFLYAPLRKDILHRAVIFEGDAHRLGRAKTKDRGEVRGSSRKLRPQKGTGKARLGDKKSPMLRGGGVAHGPKPRDFSTELPRQIYDLAWRTAISYRYRRAELIVVENSLEITSPDPSLAKTIMTRYGWGKEGGRSLFITTETRPNLEAAMEKLTTDGRVLTMKDVDVKDLLENGRVIIERDALSVFSKHRAVREARRFKAKYDDAPVVAQRHFEVKPEVVAETVENTATAN